MNFYYTKRGLLLGFVATITLLVLYFMFSGPWYDNCLSENCKTFAYYGSTFCISIISIVSSTFRVIFNFNSLSWFVISPIFLNTIALGLLGFIYDLYLKKKQYINFRYTKKGLWYGLFFGLLLWIFSSAFLAMCMSGVIGSCGTGYIIRFLISSFLYPISSLFAYPILVSMIGGLLGFLIDLYLKKKRNKNI